MADTVVKEAPFDALTKLAEEQAAAPPTRSAPRAASKGKEQARPTSRGPLERRLFQFFTMVSLVVSAVLDPQCGAVIQQRATILAKAWAELAAQDANVRKALEWLLTSGNYGQVIMVTGMTVVPILRHHNLIPGRAADILRIAVTDEGPDDDEEEWPRPEEPVVTPETHPIGDVPR